MESFGIILAVLAILIFAGTIGGGLAVFAVIIFLLGLMFISWSNS